MTQHLIKGCKGGSSSPRTPTEQPDDLQSVAKAKILIALGEGEFAGALTAKDIYLDGTPLENSDGSQNFSGVAWEFRPGTQAQNYIQGIPGSENEINVGVEVSSKTAWSRSFSNTQLSAVRLRLKWPSLLKQEDNGDLVGNAVSYAVDLQTDGGSWQTVLESAVSGKTTSGYERCHRIDLPRATTGWVLRLRKVTEDANTSKTGDVMMLQSYAEVLDAKLRYPNTALLYVEFDSRQFNGSIPKIACSPRGRVIRVPDNYDPETRQYSGIWTGAFKWAWTDNPAWIFYDLIVSDRFGLGNRLTSENIDKWTLYQVARYCDEPVPDGKGGEGTEPRYLCNVYVQDRNDAYTVLRDFAAIFRGMTCWSGDRVIALADMPRDIDYTYTRANVINGRFHYASSSSKTRYTNALVSWSDPENEYADAMEPVFEQPLVARYGFNQLELTAIGCTRQSEANRKGRWGILTNNKDRVVTFSVGLDGNIPQPGYIIAVADEMLAGKVNGGRTREVDGCVITLDRKTEAKAGDRLLLNLPSGGTQGRTIESVDGHVVTVTAEYAERPEPECVWAIESDSLRVQQYRVVGVKDNNDSTFAISAAAHDPDKYARIDSGAIIDSRPISVIPPGKQSAPANIVVESYSVVNQGISVETLQVHWTAVQNAIAYEAQWRRNEGNWINVPRSSVASFDVSGIYAGRYIVRVRAINAAEVSSGWAYSQEKTLTGKIGLPSAPVSLTTTSLLHGVQLNWAFPEGSGDTQKTELQYSPNPTGNGAMALSDVTYPGNSYQQMGLQIAATFWYRARIVDRLGNESPWTVWVQGMASDDIGEYYDKLTDAIKDTEAWQESQRDMEETHKTLTETADAIREEVEQQVNEINQSINETAGGIRKQVDGQIATVNKSMTENIDLVNQTLNDAISTVNKSINDAVSDINTSVDQQIADVNKALTAGDSALKSQLQTVENGLKQSIAQANTGWDKAVKHETADRIADVNAKAAQAADQLLNEKNERVAAIDNLQTIIQDGDESLARQIAEISAGSGQQFDSFSIWYFDKDNEGWTEDDGGQVPMQITDEGWLKASNSTASCRSPNGQKIPGSSYRTVMLRIKRVGNPAWKGRLYWIGTEETGWSDARSVTIAEQEFDGEGISVVAISDVNWNASGTVRRFRLDLAQGQNADNYFLILWISVGRPAPAASTAALRNEEMARTQADEVEALKRSTLAAQIRGTSDSNSLADLRSGLLYQEMNARITADKAEVTARESLQAQFNDNKSSVAEELSSLTTAQSAQASKISGLETSLGKKADATALQTLTQKVEQQGTTLTSQGNTLTSLSNRVGKTESGVAANSNAITGLQSSVSQQDKTLTSQSSAIAKLQNDLTTTNASVSKKADASAVTALTNRVTGTEGNLATQSGQLTMLKNSLAEGSLVSNGGMNVDLSFWENSGTGSAFTYDSGEKALKTTTGSIRVANVTRIPVEAGLTLTVSFEYRTSETVNSVSSDTVGVIADLGNPIAWLSSISPWLSGVTTNWQTKTVELTIPANFTGRYVYLRFAAGGWTPSNSARLYIRKVDVFSSTGVSKKANASAVTDLTSRVDSAEGKLVSQSQAIAKLQNDLTTTNATVSKKADQSALTSLTGRVEKTESGLTAANGNITSLTSAIGAAKAAGDDYIPNPALEPSYDRMGYDVVSATAAGVPVDCPFAYVVRLAGRDHVPKINNVAVTPGDVFEMSAVVACGTGQADFNLYIANATSATGGIKARLSGGNTKVTAAWKRVTWRFTVPADTNFMRPFLQVNQSSPFGTVWYAADWHLRNVTAAQSAQKTADATAKAVDSLTTTVSVQGDTLSSIGNRVTEAEEKLTSQSNSITQLEASLDSARDTGENLVENYDFRNQLNAWNLQNAGRIVWGASNGEGAPGVIITHTGDASNPGLMSNNAKWFPVSSSRRFRFKVRAKLISGSGGILCRIFNSKTAGTYTQTQAVVTRKDGFETLTVDIPALPATTTDARIAFYVYPSATVVAVDSIAVYDVTDETVGSANASAISDLTTRVTSAEAGMTSQGAAITKLQNDLSTTNANVNKKADATALNALSNRVTQTEKDINSQADSITSLNSTLNINARKGSNPWLDGTFETYDVNQNLGGSARVISGVSYSGGKCMRVTRAPNTTGNSDDLIGSRLAIRDAAVFRVEFWAMMPSGETPSGGWVTVVGLNVQNDAGANSWLGAANVSETALAGRDKWVKFSGYAKATAKGATRAVVWISTRGANGSNTPGYNLFIDDMVITDVTDAYNAQSTADATASAVDSLTTQVSQQGDILTSVGSRTTMLENGLNTTNGNVNKKADATALQTLQNTVTEQGKTMASQGSSLTQLNNSLNDATASLAADGKIPGNLISNGSFERGQEAFTGWGSVGSVISAQSPNYGSKIAMCGVGLAGISQKVPVVKGNTYKIGVFARAQGGSVMSDQGNNKLRIGQSSLLYDRQFNTANLPTSSSWIELTGTWKATVDGMVDVAIYSSLKSGAQYFDDFYFVDVTDEVNIAANAGAISSLTTRVTSAEGKLTSQGSSITELTNDLTTTINNVNHKADAAALAALTNRVTSAEGKLESQSSSVTSLNNSIAATQSDADAAKAIPGNMLANNSFERSFDGWVNSGWSILAAQNPKSGKYIIQATKTSSGSTACDQNVNLIAGHTYRIGAWVRKSGDFAVSNASNTKISIRNSSGPLKDIPITTSIGTGWTEIFGDYKPSSDAALTISLRSSLSAGYLYADDVFCIDVSDQVANTANASALTALNTQVKIDGGNIEANTRELKSLKADLGTKATASAVSDLNANVQEIDGTLKASVEKVDGLDITVGELKGKVKTQGETIADSEGKINSMYSIKVETKGDKRVGAGMVLASDGSTSDIIFNADRFSIFNAISKTAVPVMIAEGNELYIDSARIKNGTIDIAKITDRLSSTNYVAGWRGWSITKSGSSEFNNVVVRGEIQADTGTLNNVVINESCNILGTVRANKIIGDVGSWAINIAQHRSRRIAKAQWAWFDLLAVDRQPFEQRVQLLGALRQDDSINITGGGKLTAGMEYKSYEGGSLSMGKLGYCILMLGTGDTSGGGPMTCALSIDGVLYKQENGSMEIQSMDFIVPPGTGQTVVRYGYYLDRNGGMTGVILSRFHAFVMRNSNIIRGVSSD
ncbi:TipJ family phage tail tip protein [Klebsiella michiganensis]|uniref:TipJ family phage tail tip protein n=1 Tax=Klebsiella michiganensis TaxID=1134687 RepID=UPI00159E2EA6|nr:carbohydrate binding domain-containing protein [Klebsiella michiganensis]WBN09360.1 carbohydrate binding domain-containing protein [Klebsiella michiganensis]HDS7119884.1 carbohydrate binding domain-containing protein [Klebsiella michiganensis]HED2925989.1 carbohydrate binding domain-containing protein [Klebsiella michiganensis]